MKTSGLNIEHNARNPHQGRAKKVLFVCSAGLLRSPTIAQMAASQLGYNTRACGSVTSIALIPLSTALAFWADEIVFVHEDVYSGLSSEEKDYIGNLEHVNGVQVSVLDIPDNFAYSDPELCDIIYEQYIYPEMSGITAKTK